MAKRVIICLFDSFGLGPAQDAAKYQDSQADTFGHIVEYCHQVRQQPLHLPNLWQLGLYHAAENCRNQVFDSAAKPDSYQQLRLSPHAAFGVADELSLGKDTPSGHWELMGLPVDFDWGYFPRTVPCFPSALTDALITRGQLPGVLGNCHASGTDILKELGALHVASGQPIVYTSADSVFQIAAHEQTFGLERLYALCDLARELVDPYQIGRVIARPFLGDTTDTFYRTANRRDLVTPPHGPILFDAIQAAGGRVISVGKVADIFAHRSVNESIKADGNLALFDATMDVLQREQDEKNDTIQLIFTNFVDFDSRYGHRRDPAGYAAALEQLDARLPELLGCLTAEDLLVITADHGCDPTMPGSDHTREAVPLLLYGSSVRQCDIGRRASFADLGQTLASYFSCAPVPAGESFLTKLQG